MDKAVELAKTFKENVEKLGFFVQQLCDIILELCDIILDHEKRLEEVEKPLDIATEAKYFRTYILGIEDPEKRDAALVKLASLCEALGITHLEV